uniref:tRNA (guanine(46)-N(7))-methyltransferase n=1 Tax=uncultured Bacteroidota bacterium TaxID=152509 RepID=H5SMR7_9BACT|nr:tRNA (guanine-N7-)-methyltransferase [uncultured Bacteroidetes bacterium]
MAFAEHHPTYLVIGLDRRADRLAEGCRLAALKKLPSIGFWHGDALLLSTHFAPQEVNEIWLNYPDPYPKRRHEKHRLMHPRYLWQYTYVLKPGGRLHLRTDSRDLYAYALDQLHTQGWHILLATPDLMPGEGPPPAHWETLFRQRKGGTIHYIEAVPPALP